MKISKQEIEKIGFVLDDESNSQIGDIEQYIFAISPNYHYAMCVHYRDYEKDIKTDHPSILLQSWAKKGSGENLEDYKVEIIFNRMKDFESMEDLLNILKQVPYIFN